MGTTHRAGQSKILKEKHFSNELLAELAVFCWFFFFFFSVYRKEYQTSCGYSHWGILRDILSKGKKQMNQTCHCKENNCQFLLLMIKIRALKPKLEFWKMCNHNPEFDSFSVLKKFSDVIC